MEPVKFLIGNKFVSTGDVAEIKNPYTQQTVRKVYKAGKKHIDSALNYLGEVFPLYKNVPVYQKADILEKISDKIRERKNELAELITLETSKPIKFSKVEIDRAVLTFKLGSEEAKRIEGEVINLDLLKGSEGYIGIVRRFPLGIILAITPWNFPINLLAHKISPALASGNVVLLKPASASFTCGIELVKIIRESCEESGLDFCPVNVVTSSGKDTEEFVSDPRVKMVSFTGSSSVGWGLKKKTNEQKISLELGGNAGVIVDETADLERAVEKVITGGFASAGQSCISVQRVFVHEKLYNEFKEKLVSETKRIKVGDPFDEETVVSAMITLSDAEEKEKWIKEAEKKGAEILTGGERDEALLKPTVIGNTTPEMKVNSSEVFAPVITLHRFDDFKEAVKEVDDSKFGLQAGVFTKNLNNAFYAYNNIEAGGVIINDVPTYRMDSMPYGGMKDSGNTREGVKYAIEEMTERKVMVVAG